MKKHLILFSIGPVQSFIAQARKTHDLHAGSRLLSDLIKVAIEKVGKENLIFPSLGEAMPNRFLAWIPRNEENLNEFGATIEEIVRDKWKEIANSSLDGMPQKPNGFDQQIEDHLEIFWVIESLGDNYAETVKNLDQQLAAIKNLRTFKQFNWQDGILGEQGRKCSLDGHRNVQFYRPKTNESVAETYSPLYSTKGGVYIKKHFPDAVLQLGEGLSAVSYVKRRYQQGRTKGFKSTSEIALLDVLQKVQDLTELKTCIVLLNSINAHLFYEENLNDTALSKYLDDAEIERQSADSIRMCSQKVRNAINEKGLKQTKYYAVLTFDGDNMGSWLAGGDQGEVWLKPGIDVESFHKLLATQLSIFAKEAKTFLDNKRGQTVYAGGDDFLGFVNLNHLTSTLIELRRLFRIIVDDPLSSHKTKEITFSSGICIAHYKEPLSLVLQEAKAAQKKAKDHSNKNAFSISVIKGSGESHSLVLSFGDLEKNIYRFENLAHALVRNDFSNSFIKTLHLEFGRVLNFNDNAINFEYAFRSELKRLLKRSARSNWNEDEKNEGVDRIAEDLMELFSTNKTYNFFQTLHIADFLQREIDAPIFQENAQQEPQKA
jgi:CRISPR-associated protein Cmr2